MSSTTFRHFCEDPMNATYISEVAAIIVAIFLQRWSWVILVVLFGTSLLLGIINAWIKHVNNEPLNDLQKNDFEINKNDLISFCASLVIGLFLKPLMKLNSYNGFILVSILFVHFELFLYHFSKPDKI